MPVGSRRSKLVADLRGSQPLGGGPTSRHGEQGSEDQRQKERFRFRRQFPGEPFGNVLKNRNGLVVSFRGLHDRLHGLRLVVFQQTYTPRADCL